MEKLSQPVRILALVIVLAGAAGMLALRMLGPSAVVETSATTVVPQPAGTAKAKRTTQAKSTPKATNPAKQVEDAGPAKAAAAGGAPNAPTARPTGFPLAIDAALQKHRVLVVSLVLPGARVDALAAAEARAGAKLGGAGYVALNVLNEDVARALLSKLSALEDPSVLVLKRSGEVAVQLAGFVDRETVAQAAATASS